MQDTNSYEIDLLRDMKMFYVVSQVCLPILFFFVLHCTMYIEWGQPYLNIAWAQWTNTRRLHVTLHTDILRWNFTWHRRRRSFRPVELSQLFLPQGAHVQCNKKRPISLNISNIIAHVPDKSIAAHLTQLRHIVVHPILQ